MFTYDEAVAAPAVKQLQPALIFAPQEARALLGGKDAPALMDMGLKALSAVCAGCHADPATLYE
jgi:hypothetical protein